MTTADLMAAENANLREDLLVARLYHGYEPSWRRRQDIKWADALHRTLLKSVAY